MSRSNPTGFDLKKFTAAAHPKSEWAARDPWARGELWRYTGPFSRFNRFRRTFPGLGIATVAFTGYLVYEQMFMQDSHGHGHGEEEGGHH